MNLNIKERFRKTAFEVAWRLRFLENRLRLLLGLQRIESVFHRPTDMCESDRLMIYALVRGLRPKRVLEIGVRWGGSARIICAALQDNGEGFCVGLEPYVHNFRVPARKLYGRYELVRGYSHADVPKAIARLGTPVDLVFIDATHIYACALADINAVSPYLSKGGHILMHDTFHVGIDAAVREFMKHNPDIEDLGILTRHAHHDMPVMYQGLRLLRVGKACSQQMITTAYGEKLPEDTERLWNYNQHSLKIGQVREVDGRYEYVDES